MNPKCVIVLPCLIVLCLCPLIAQADDTPTAAEVRQAMVRVLTSMEQAAGLEPKASRGIAEMDDEAAEIIFSAMQNKKEYIAATEKIVDRIELAAERIGASGVALAPMLNKAGTDPYPPDYPDGAYYAWAALFGLVDSPDDRCSGTILDEYEAALLGAEEALYLGDAACTVAGCDPTGIVCASVCAPVEVIKIAVWVAKLPLRVCDGHEGNVDSAEIEAGYENSVSILGDLEDHDANIDDDLADHDTNIDGDLADHDTNIDGDLAAHDANIDGDLSVHDTDIKALLALLTGQVVVIQGSLDTKVELRRIHLQIIMLKSKERFLLAAEEGGEPVDVTLLGVMASKGAAGDGDDDDGDGKRSKGVVGRPDVDDVEFLTDGELVEFVDVPAVGTPVMGATGFLDVTVDLPLDLQNAKIFQFRVKDSHFDDDGILSHEHFGTIVYHRIAGGDDN